MPDVSRLQRKKIGQRVLHTSRDSQRRSKEVVFVTFREKVFRKVRKFEVPTGLFSLINLPKTSDELDIFTFKGHTRHTVRSCQSILSLGFCANNGLSIVIRRSRCCLISLTFSEREWLSVVISRRREEASVCWPDCCSPQNPHKLGHCVNCL